MLMRRALKGDLPLIPAAMKVFEEVMSPGMPEMPGDELLEAEIARRRRLQEGRACCCSAASCRSTRQKAAEEQELLSFIADVMIDIFACESSLLRALDADKRKLPNAALHADVVRAMVSDAAGRIEQLAKSVIAAIAEGDMQRMQLAALKRVLKVTPVNTVVIRRALADALVSKGSYIFS